MAVAFMCPKSIWAQGPPITGDKPIMLAKGNVVLKTLSEVRALEKQTALISPLMVHYIPQKNVLVGVHIPLINTLSVDADTESMSGLGDVQFLGKYQFYRNDQMGKTFRIVAKTLQLLPTGQETDIEGQSEARYRSYYGFVAGLETIKYGISNETGIKLDPAGDTDLWRYKLGFGLPLKKPVYPVDQINLYFEYQSDYYFDGRYMLLYGQGIQYAKKRVTLETAVQFPLFQIDIPDARKRRYSLIFGARYVI